LLQYNSVLKRFDQSPLLIIFFFKNPAKKRRHSWATNRAMSFSTYPLEYGVPLGGPLGRRELRYDWKSSLAKQKLASEDSEQPSLMLLDKLYPK